MTQSVKRRGEEGGGGSQSLWKTSRVALSSPPHTKNSHDFFSQKHVPILSDLFSYSLFYAQYTSFALFQFLVGVTVVPRQILKFKLVQNFGRQTRCIMDNVKVANEYLILIINRTAGTAKEHEGSAPRKWEENHGQSKPRKRYAINFVIKKTRIHLGCTLQKLFFTYQPGQFTKHFTSSCFQHRKVDWLITVFFPVLQTVS